MYVISRIESYKFSQAAAVYAESERTLARYDNPDYKPELSCTNVHLMQPFVGSVENLLLQLKKDFGCRMVTDSSVVEERQTNVLCQCLFSASPEFIEEMTKPEIDNYYKSCLYFFQQKFPSVPILSAVIHYDEVTPHMHVTFLPVCTKENKKGELKTLFSTSELFKGRDFFPKYQEEFYQWMLLRYPERHLQRKGDVKQEHLTVQEYKERKREIAELERVVENLKEEVEVINSVVEDAKSVPSIALQIQNAELENELSKYRKFVRFLLEKFPQLNKAYEVFQRSGKGVDRAKGRDM